MYQLTEQKTNLGCVWVIFGLAFLVPGLFAAALIPTEGFGPAIFSCIFVGIGLVTFFILISNYLKSRRIDDPIIAISEPNASIGQTLTVTYQQSINTKMDVKMMRFQLIFKETARYRQGTDTYTETEEHVVDEYRMQEGSFPKGHIFSDNWQFQIPEGSMHTFKSTNNRLEWYISLILEEKFKHENTFEIPVLPVILPSEERF